MVAMIYLVIQMKSSEIQPFIYFQFWYFGLENDNKAQRKNLRSKFVSWPLKLFNMDSNAYRLLLPKGTLDYFDLVNVQESLSDVVIYLEEKNVVPE